jgi:ADP-ribose pyrophosphatase YjhB (NUDIX family)
MAVARELEEELNVRTLSVQPAIFEVRDPKSPFVITFFPVEIEGEPAQLEHAAVAWVAARDLPFLALAPSDARFVDAVVAPRRP